MDWRICRLPKQKVTIQFVSLRDDTLIGKKTESDNPVTGYQVGYNFTLQYMKPIYRNRFNCEFPSFNLLQADTCFPLLFIITFCRHKAEGITRSSV